MAEPESSTSKAADTPPKGAGDDSPVVAAARASRPALSAAPPSSPSPSEPALSRSAPRVPVTDPADVTAPIAIDPDAVVETTRGDADAALEAPRLADSFEVDARRKSRPTTDRDADADRVAEAKDASGPSTSSAPDRASTSSSPASQRASQRASQSSGSSSARVSAGLAVAGTPSANALASDARPLAAYELLARSARLGDLVALTDRIVTDAALARVSDWAFGSKVSAAADDAKLARADADTRFGNVLDVLGTGGEGAAERALASALWAHAVAESPRSRSEDEDRLAGDILWLATHTAFDATPLLDRALGDEAADLWTAIADRVRRIERGRGGALGRGEAVVGCAALAASGAEQAQLLCATLANEVKDPVLLRVLATGESSARDEVRLEGELASAPRGVVATTLLAFSGLLFAAHAVRLLARLALAYRRPTEVSLSESGVRVKTRIELLGRTLREREHVILRTGLVRVVREVRYPRAAFYAGLLALAVGSYVGVRSFVDGVRAASPSLLVVGLLIVAIGIAADFVLGSLLPGSRGRCRLAFVPRTGPTVCIGEVDVRRADEALARSLSRR